MGSDVLTWSQFGHARPSGQIRYRRDGSVSTTTRRKPFTGQSQVLETVYGRYCQMLWMRWIRSRADGAAEESVMGNPGSFSGGFFEHELSVGEGVALHQVCDQLVAVETAPVLLCLGGQLEDHRQGRDP